MWDIFDPKSMHTDVWLELEEKIFAASLVRGAQQMSISALQGCT